MTWDALWRRVNIEAEQEYRFKRDPYEFAQKHLHEWKFKPWSKAAYYAFGRNIDYGFPSSLVEPSLRRKPRPRFPWLLVLVLIALLAIAL